MAVPTIDTLITHISQVRENPGVPYEASKGMSRDDLTKAFAVARASLIEALESAPSNAFDKQSANGDGDEVWSAGEIVAHCNSSVIGIGSEALKLVGVDDIEPPKSLKESSETRVMSQDEALGAARLVSADDLFGLIPEDADLDSSAEHDFFGTMSARAWLYFLSMHEAEHVSQIQSLG